MDAMIKEFQKYQKEALTQGLNQMGEFNRQSNKAALSLLEANNLLPQEGKDAAKKILNAQLEAFTKLESNAKKVIEIDFASEKAGDDVLGLFEGAVSEVFAKAEEAKKEGLKQVKELSEKLPAELKPFTGYFEKNLDLGLNSLKSAVTLQVELGKQILGNLPAIAKAAAKTKTAAK